MASRQCETNYRVRLSGIVQGVGFRPFVYQEAIKYGIHGTVWNNNGDVIILASGSRFSEFIDSIKQNKPIASWIENISITTIEPFETEGFTITESFEGDQNAPRFFSPDIAMCEQCQNDIYDKSNRRSSHYFNNCTICGPRFTVLNKFPYDRANTTMDMFLLCEDCLKEYNSPDNRRFHAETICCPQCGPTLYYKRKNELYINNEAYIEATKDLAKGIAIKGIGGYHLACSPYDEPAIQQLRQIKLRETKPFALMFKDIAAISDICEISVEEEKLLTSSARPIVLLKMKHKPFPHSLLNGADGCCGCFLPYTPLQSLLLNEISCIVMTSANLSSSPIIKGEDEIFTLTDHVLYHNREIVRGIEDSVIQVTAGKPSFIRRGRGFTPLPLTIHDPDNKQLLAAGGDLKASFGILTQQSFILSQPFGDLENNLAFKQYEQSITDYEKLFTVKPQAIICDAHPRYFSSILAKQISVNRDIPLIKVQHHHAHIASVMAEHQLHRVLGVAMDGTGYGDDGNIWGGEFLICEEGNYRRAGHLAYTKIIDLDAAKTAVCYLHSHKLQRSPSHPNKDIIKAALDNNINCFYTSSMGRLFDVVSVLLGICTTNSYEGECAILLQYKAEQEKKANISPLDMHFDIKVENGIYVCHFSDILLKCQQNIAGAALSFHKAVCSMITQVCINICSDENVKDVALSGGVFQNSLLVELLNASLGQSGLNIFTNERVPSNDGGISLGQAFIVANRKGQV